MKKVVIVTLIILGLGNISFAQTGKKSKDYIKVPAQVQQAFSKQYPNVKAKWEIEAGKYEAGFKQNGHKMSALYEISGILIETETEIAIHELPNAVGTYVRKHNLGKIKNAAKIIKANGKLEYEAEVKDGDALFDEKSNFIKITKD